MGYAYYEIYRNGEKIQAGYGVEAVCEEPGCEEQIDRGLYHLCGNTPGGDEYGCGRYFCGDHLFLGSGAPVSEGLCQSCDIRYEAAHADPLEASPDAMSVSFGPDGEPVVQASDPGAFVDPVLVDMVVVADEAGRERHARG